LPFGHSEYNPIPVYDRITSWEAPTLELEAAPRLQLISIDNLPSVLALEASLAFGDRLLPLLLDFPHSKCWAHSASIFRERLALLDREA
jgi:saccharopine dehydrogenase (NAD+, L-lysine-forming)